MAGRAYWKGYLKLSLVSCPVKLYPATSSTAGKISFNMLHKDTLNRVQQKYHDPELGEIDRADLVKGYQFEKDRYVVVTNEELEAVEGAAAPQWPQFVPSDRRGHGKAGTGA